MKDLIAVFLLFLFAAAAAHADYVLYELPTQFEGSTSLSKQTLGGACLAQAEIQDGVPCAASMLGLVKRPRFFGTALVGNGYEALKTTSDILYKPLTRSEFEALFSDKSSLVASGSVKLSFIAPHFAAQFAPFQASLNSVIRNSSFPVIGVHAINERSLIFSWGAEKWKNVLLGTHLRIFERRFVHEEFQLFQAITNSGSILKPQDQSGFSIDPSLTWWFDNPWHFRWTMALENIGWVNRVANEVPFQTQLMSGVGASIPMSLGQLEFGLDLHIPRENRVGLRDLMFGSNYRLGALQFMAGINQFKVSTGVRFALRNVDLGVSYSSTQWPSGTRDDYQQSLLTQIGLGF